MITELSERSREIFRRIVETYLETGEPIGSRTLARRLTMALSPATIRNVMADLEESGLLFAPHTSAGRMPTDAGLRLFVDGLLEVGSLTDDERRHIDAQCAGSGADLEELLEEATSALSGLSRYAGLVLAPKTDSPLKHIGLVNLSPGRALVILVTESGVVENRIIETPHGMAPSALVEAGLATWAGGQKGGTLIVRGQANLLDDITVEADLERIRSLFAALETKEMMLRVLSLADTAEGVRIYIGADNRLFNLAGVSMIVGPYNDRRQKVVGAIGVIGPTRMNYARIIPLVDYTAQMIGRRIG